MSSQKCTGGTLIEQAPSPVPVRMEAKATVCTGVLGLGRVSRCVPRCRVLEDREWPPLVEGLSVRRPGSMPWGSRGGEAVVNQVVWWRAEEARLGASFRVASREALGCRYGFKAPE